MRTAYLIDPCFVTKTDRVDDERIAFVSRHSGGVLCRISGLNYREKGVYG
jgi:hypothetical protein